VQVNEPGGRPDAPILLVTKLHRPVVPPETVTRERLFERLRGGRGRRLSLIACPAGFGKSTVLADWCERECGQRPVAWVTVDEGDNDVVVLWSHVIASLCRIAAHESVAWFVERLPLTVQLVLSSRTDPPLALGTLRARGQLVELRADDLRFTRGETEAFLNDRLELDLSDDDLDLLVARTEGWPAGIYLAALSLKGRPDKSRFVRAFDGTSAHVVDFLSNEVLNGYDSATQTFMLRTSVLERLCAELCDAVLGDGVAENALASLARSNLFLLPLDDQRRWFRFHHLFAQLLRVELERRDGALVPELHRRAYAWHAEFGTTDEAIHHAVAAHAYAEAGELIAGSWVRYVNAGRAESVVDWLARLPATAVKENARLLLVRAWLAALRGREPEMRAALEMVPALGHVDDGPLSDGFASLESSMSVLRAAFAWGDVAAVLAEGERSARLEGLDSPWRPVVAWSLGWAYYCRGDLDLAERWLEEAVALAPAAEQWVVGVGAAADLSLLAGMRGRRTEQLRRAEETVAWAGECGLLDACEVGEVHTAHGAALAAHDRWGDAIPALEKGVLLRRLWGQPLDLADGLIALGSALAATGDAARAAEIFAETEALLDGCTDPGGLPDRLMTARQRQPPSAPAEGKFSERELTVLRMLSGGMTEREIGRELFVSFNTVHSHVKSVYRKLSVSSRADAVSRAREQRLL
jgi:LuxR family maltose regulon positive regulatory protein